MSDEQKLKSVPMDESRSAERAEEALRKSEERFSLFMKHLPGVAFIKDPAGKYVYANDQVCSLVNQQIEDVLWES